MQSKDFDINQFTGRNRRLLYEWQKMEYAVRESADGRDGESLCGGRSGGPNAFRFQFSVLQTTPLGLPTSYLVEYKVRGICGVTNMESLNRAGVVNEPLFADRFLMRIDLPESYPCVDGSPRFRFLTEDLQGNAIPHPWHPNIRWAGDFAGRVCVNMADTYTDLVWGVERVAGYLSYDSYHAICEPPYPEDQQVAAWVIRQAEPYGWIPF